jgi:DNA-binding response OmpR family regulator
MGFMKQRKLTALVVEDERALQAAIKAKMETENFTVLTAQGADQALD